MINIVEFYQRLSKLLEKYREEDYSRSTAIRIFNELMQEAKEANLDVEVNSSIFLDMDTLSEFDDERSYESNYSYDSSYDEESESSW